MSVSKRFLLRTIFVLVLILAMFLVACNKDKDNDNGTDEPNAVTLPVFNGEKEDLNTESLTSLIHNYYGGIPQQESESPESKLDDTFVNSVKSASGFKADNVSYEVYQKYTLDCIALGYEIEGELVEDD